jgi:hypothetical protein
MHTQSKALRWLRITVVVMGVLQLGFCAGALAVQDVYLLSTLVEQRMGFLGRSFGYRRNGVKACIRLRNLQLDLLAAPNQEAQHGMSAASAEERSELKLISTTMLDIHSLNYISPPSQEVPPIISRDFDSGLHLFSKYSNRTRSVV